MGAGKRGEARLDGLELLLEHRAGVQERLGDRLQRIMMSHEIPHPTRYLDENSQMSFAKGVRYGLSILRTVSRYMLHRLGLWRQDRFRVG